MHIWLVDHHDSFTLNIREWLLAHPIVTEVMVVPFDDDLAMEQLAKDAAPVVLGPGPKDPDAILPTRRLLDSLQSSRPLLGICLGHQLLASMAGASLVRAAEPVHGATVALHGDAVLCRGRVAVYNSLVVAECPPGWEVTARNEQGEIMAISSLSHPLRWGWQFHPESFLTEEGAKLAAMFLERSVYVLSATEGTADKQSRQSEAEGERC